MNVKKIVSLCKQAKAFGSTIDADGSQWLGDGYAFYQLPTDTPILEANTISALYDIDREKMNNEYVYKEFIADKYLTSDTCEDEELLREIFIKVRYAGKELMPFASRNGLILIDTKYLAPLDLKNYEMYFMLRKEKVVIKKGMFAISYIKPFNISDISEDFDKQLSELYKQHSIRKEKSFVERNTEDE